MGLFNKVKKKFNRAVGLGENNDLFNVGAGIMTMGASELVSKSEKGELKDLFLGKKAKDINPDAIADQIRATQSKGIGELNAALDESGEGIVRQQSELEKKGILTAAQDARRNAQRVMAQSGMKGSSLGLAANRSIAQTAGREVSALNAQLPGQIRNQKLNDAQTRINVGGVNQNGMNFNTIEGTRSGGILGYAAQLAPLAGSVGQVMSGSAALKRENRMAGG